MGIIIYIRINLNRPTLSMVAERTMSEALDLLFAGFVFAHFAHRVVSINDGSAGDHTRGEQLATPATGRGEFLEPRRTRGAVQFTFCRRVRWCKFDKNIQSQVLISIQNTRIRIRKSFQFNKSLRTLAVVFIKIRRESN